MEAPRCELNLAGQRIRRKIYQSSHVRARRIIAVPNEAHKRSPFPLPITVGQSLKRQSTGDRLGRGQRAAGAQRFKRMGSRCSDMNVPFRSSREFRHLDPTTGSSRQPAGPCSSPNHRSLPNHLQQSPPQSFDPTGSAGSSRSRPHIRQCAASVVIGCVPCV